jgi:hypothetical protein
MFGMSYKETIRFCSFVVCFVSDFLWPIDWFDSDIRRQTDPGRQPPETFPGMTRGPPLPRNGDTEISLVLFVRSFHLVQSISKRERPSTTCCLGLDTKQNVLP